MILHGHWCSSAAYRVRPALRWKGLDVTHHAIDLRIGARHDPDYLSVNRQVLVDCPVALGQSLAIIEYIEETHQYALRENKAGWNSNELNKNSCAGTKAPTADS